MEQFRTGTLVPSLLAVFLVFPRSLRTRTATKWRHASCLRRNGSVFAGSVCRAMGTPIGRGLTDIVNAAFGLMPLLGRPSGWAQVVVGCALGVKFAGDLNGGLADIEQRAAAFFHHRAGFPVEGFC